LLDGCKRKAPPIESDDAGGAGLLRRIAARLEEAYAAGPLPRVTEPDGLADRLTRWRGFRECAARTYAVLRPRAAAAGQPPSAAPRPARLLRHDSVGDAAVEECAVQGAVADRDPGLCQRLAADYAGVRGEPPLAALRCWDTRARVLGLPDECPVVEVTQGARGRNPECLAAARRDPSLCVFAEDGPRCRAILASDAGLCTGGASDCKAAVTYWAGLVPRAEEPPLVAGQGKLRLTLNGDRDDSRLTSVLDAAPQARALSWPTATDAVAKLVWGADPVIRLAFLPRGEPSGARRFELPGGAGGLLPPGSHPPAGLALHWKGGRTCAAVSGTLRFEAGDAQPGSRLTGSLDAVLRCSDGASPQARGEIDVAILDRY